MKPMEPSAVYLARQWFDGKDMTGNVFSFVKSRWPGPSVGEIGFLSLLLPLGGEIQKDCAGLSMGLVYGLRLVRWLFSPCCVGVWVVSKQALHVIASGNHAQCPAYAHVCVCVCAHTHTFFGTRNSTGKRKELRRRQPITGSRQHRTSSCRTLENRGFFPSLFSLL